MKRLSNQNSLGYELAFLCCNRNHQPATSSYVLPLRLYPLPWYSTPQEMYPFGGIQYIFHLVLWRTKHAQPKSLGDACLTMHRIEVLVSYMTVH